MRSLAILAAAAGTLAGCDTYGDDPLVFAPAGSPYRETSAICDSQGLESQLVSLRDGAARSRDSLSADAFVGAGPGVVERVYELRDKLNRFEAETDVQYRAMAASCRSYARCMEMNAYKEAACAASRNDWREARGEFADLTVSLRQIEAEVEKARLSAVGRARGGPARGYDVNRRESCNCSAPVGGVFSANCC